MAVEDPRGFRTVVSSLGVKDATPDFAVIAADRPCAAAAVFTRSRFAGPSVVLSRRNVASGRLQAIVSISKNANVATGSAGMRDAEEVVRLAAELVGVPPADVLIGSTGVIGRPYPMDRIRSGISRLAVEPSGDGAGYQAVAEAMMTTDTHPKLVRGTLAGEYGEVCVVGLAKGVGMIEPDMATLLTYFITDAEVEPGPLDDIFRRVVDRSFNCVSVDSDTSTSDTAAILASGAAGPVDLGRFEATLLALAEDLARQVARDGEGATRLIEVRVDGARNEAQARRVAKSIVNSPLVKTAVHGQDPNWGRVAMAVGKCYADPDDQLIDPERTVIRFGPLQVFPAREPDLSTLSEVMAGEEVLIHVSLGLGDSAARVWGCDLSAGYVRINADYTT